MSFNRSGDLRLEKRDDVRRKVGTAVAALAIFFVSACGNEDNNNIENSQRIAAINEANAALVDAKSNHGTLEAKKIRTSCEQEDGIFSDNVVYDGTKDKETPVSIPLDHLQDLDITDISADVVFSKDGPMYRRDNTGQYLKDSNGQNLRQFRIWYRLENADAVRSAAKQQLNNLHSVNQSSRPEIVQELTELSNDNSSEYCVGGSMVQVTSNPHTR
jgi:hypothetical protein